MISKIKKPFRALAKQIPSLRKVMRKIMYITRRIIYLIHGMGISVDQNTIIFEAYSGKSYSCSPKAIYEYMISNEKFGNYSFIWIMKEPERHKRLEENPRTTIVKYMSKDCNKALHRAKYWIFNYRALDYWKPNKKQIYVQCWHGTPLKRLGFDIEKSDNAMNSLQEIRDKYEKDAKRFKFLLSPCEFSTDKFKSAWNLRKYGKENSVLEIGYPRNDFLINHNEEDVLAIKAKLGFGKEKRKLILYAPTWRDNQHDAGIGYTYKCEADFNLMRQELEDEYIILFRAHYLVSNALDFSAYAGFVYDVSDVDDINELYVISDMLITDYSSVFFDYAILNKPILFYMYDLDSYRDELRGFYLDLDELPGKINENIDCLIDEIKAVNKLWKPNKKYIEFNKSFNYLNDGKATERLLEKVIKSEKKKDDKNTTGYKSGL